VARCEEYRHRHALDDDRCRNQTTLHGTGDLNAIDDTAVQTQLTASAP